MRFNSPYCFSVLTLALAIGVSTLDLASAQQMGYQSAGQMSGQVMQAGGIPPQATPPLPAAPLAGGASAAEGGAYMDVHGRPIVLPASYCPTCPDGCQGCPGGGYGGAMGGMGGMYGDPMAVDFGGYAHEQCGPHYFDVQAGVVFLELDEAFDGLGFFSQLGAGGDFFLNPAAEFGEYEPGWEIAFRYDIGPLAVLEAEYTGLYDIGFSDSVGDPNNNNSLVSVFSNFGFGSAIPGIDDVNQHQAEYQADLQSTAFNYRRYWVGHSPSVSGTWILGARYIRFTDDFNFVARTFNPVPSPGGNVETGRLFWEGKNDLVGFHFGGDASACIRQGLRVNCEGTTGIYNNRFKLQNVNSGLFEDPNDPSGFNRDGNQVAFAAEGEVSIIADILPSWSLRAGYKVLFINSLATAENNILQAAGVIDPDFQQTPALQQGMLFHGFQGGLEYVW